MKNSIFCLIGVLIALIVNAQETTIADYLIQNVNIVDVTNGTIKTNQQVAIKSAQIIAINEGETAPKAKKIIDGTDQYLIPGLWDMHTHYRSNYTYSSQLLVANGITGVREMWGLMDTIKHIRAQTKAGNIIAPDIYSAGNIIDGKPQLWPGSAGVSTIEEVTQEVDAQIAEGVDFLKVYSLLTKEAYIAIAKKSKTAGIPFAGHIPDGISFWEAIEAGQQSTEHLYGLLEACTSQPERLPEFSGWKLFSAERMDFLLETFDRSLFDSLATTLANSNTWLSPTLTVLHNMANLDDSTLAYSPRMDYIPPYFKETWNPKNDFRFKYSPPAYFEASRRTYKLQHTLVNDLEKAGVKIIAGTDFPNPYCYPGYSLHDELALLVNGGMSPSTALKTATYNPALFMGKVEAFGQVKEGQLASLVLLDANPLEAISNTKKIQAVFLRGEYLDRAALDHLLEEAKTIAKETNDPFKY